MHKHTQRGSTYRWRPTFRSSKLSGSVASCLLDKSLQPSPHHRPSVSHASTSHLDAILAHPFSMTAPCMHKVHTEGQHLQVAPNLQVAKALRQCCQLIVVQGPATVTTLPPISVTCQHFPPRCNPCTPLQHHCTMHAQTTHRGAALTGSPQPSGCQSSQAVLPADCCSSSCNQHHITAHQRHMPALPTTMQSLPTPSASLHTACTKYTQRGSTYMEPPTFRSPKLSGSVAS